MNRKLENKDELIANLERQGVLRDSIIDYHVRNVDIYEVELKGLRTKIEQNAEAYNREIKREKRKVRLYKLTTFAVSAGAVYLLLK